MNPTSPASRTEAEDLPAPLTQPAPRRAVVQAKDLTLTSARGTVYGPVSLHVREGDLVVLQGPQGSGRSSLLLTLAGRMNPDRDTRQLTVLGHELPRGRRAVQQLSAVAGFDAIDRLDESVTVADTLRERLTWRWHTPDGDGVTLDVAAFLADRGDTVRYVRNLLARTSSRPANVGCFGLHEWAMVYRQGDATRHPLPLRLGARGTDEVVESHPVRCSHFDAFRFFTPEAAPLNRLQPTRENQPELEQPGCLHANMDLFKWAEKLGPAVPGALLLDCFELARDVRYLDMQASPYDVSSYGLPAVAIETPGGKAEYSDRQRGFAERASALRERLVAVCDDVLSTIR